MSQPRPTICLPALLGCLLATSAVGCQSFGPSGYGGYPGNYNNYPVYQPGQVVPYQGAPGGMSAPGTIISPQPGTYPQSGAYPQPSPYPQSGFQNTYPPGGAPPFNPGFNPNYSLPSGNQNPGMAPDPAYRPNPGVGTNPRPALQGAEADEFGQPGQFPGATGTSNTTTRPRMPADEKFPVPDYNDPSQPGSTTPPVNSTNRSVPPAVDLGEESFQGPINGSKRATQKLEDIEEEITPPTTAIPKKTSMLENEADGATVDFVPPVAGRAARNIIQTAQHQEGPPTTIRPYGRAVNGEAWFRGIVDFDEEEKTWYLIYNPQPAEADERGGIVTLLDHPLLQHLRSDDTVLVEGAFNPQSTDRYGHPRYQIQSVTRLVPPQVVE